MQKLPPFTSDFQLPTALLKRAADKNHFFTPTVDTGGLLVDAVSSAPQS